MATIRPYDIDALKEQIAILKEGGKTITETATTLNDMGYRSKNGATFTAPTIAHHYYDKGKKAGDPAPVDITPKKPKPEPEVTEMKLTPNPDPEEEKRKFEERLQAEYPPNTDVDIDYGVNVRISIPLELYNMIKCF